MNLTKRMQHKISAALIASALIFFAPAYADDYRDARAELIAAYQAENYPKMLLAARKAAAARPGYPGGLFNLALSQTLNSDHHGSLQTLEILVEKGVDFGASELADFAAVRELDGWGAYSSKLKNLSRSVGAAEVAGTYPVSKFVPEGIAIDNDGELLIGSIHTGQLVKLSLTPEVLLERGVSWSVFGMRFHADGSLWFASAAVPELAGVADDSGQTGLFRLDVSSGAITRAAILPQYEPQQLLGDLVIADDNILYASDSLSGAIYRYYIDANEFETVVERGKLRSPQGLVLNETGSYLFVADYIGGLYRVALQDGSFVRVDVPDSITDYGIDGLYRYDDELVVIQNGIRPHQIAALQLSDNGLAVVGRRLLAANLEQFDDPTLGVIHDDDFYFVANSHWNRFDREHKLPDDLSGPIILKLRLD
jgi:hypothetical protein